MNIVSCEIGWFSFLIFIIFKFDKKKVFEQTLAGTTNFVKRLKNAKKLIIRGTNKVRSILILWSPGLRGVIGSGPVPPVARRGPVGPIPVGLPS